MNLKKKYIFYLKSNETLNSSQVIRIDSCNPSHTDNGEMFVANTLISYYMNQSTQKQSRTRNIRLIFDRKEKHHVEYHVYFV